MALSPKILSSGWGKIQVEGLANGKDYKLWPGGGRSWNWNEHGTGHGSGILVGDVGELVDHGCRVVVLTFGRFKRLRVPEQTVSYLKQKGIEVAVAETKEGIGLYNDYARAGVAVGGLFHTTY